MSFDNRFETVGLRKGDFSLTLCLPNENAGYYRGTRFDRAGIFRDIQCKGHVYVDEWFDTYDPFRHDCVCGPVEEFTQIGYDDVPAGNCFLKIGVGMLRKPVEDHYDRFNLYEIADPGEWRVTSSENEIVFVHRLRYGNYGYDYVKKITLTGTDSFRISHSLSNEGSALLSGSVYDHNFFTLDDMRVGPLTGIRFPFKPKGDWRTHYDCVSLSDDGIRFGRNLKKGESVFMGNLHGQKEGDGYSFELSNGITGAGVDVGCPSPFKFMVFWANCRAACLEPYIPFRVCKGETSEWDITYKLILT
ncbi:MAG: hypothetical protein LKI42_02350 [Bacteroidales bacterium]|jgi:hypothetical protein|nr:hypothetical protein [Bacteroidales bacterium]MCI1785077.1 hypothetical protein [Bacteroidales bacterium]